MGSRVIVKNKKNIISLSLVLLLYFKNEEVITLIINIKLESARFTENDHFKDLNNSGTKFVCNIKICCFLYKVKVLKID